MLIQNQRHDTQDNETQHTIKREIQHNSTLNKNTHRLLLFMLCAAFLLSCYCYAGRLYAECYYAGCLYAEYHVASDPGTNFSTGDKPRNGTILVSIFQNFFSQILTLRK
jgi:hypothetical protein